MKTRPFWCPGWVSSPPWASKAVFEAERKKRTATLLVNFLRTRDTHQTSVITSDPIKLPTVTAVGAHLGAEPLQGPSRFAYPYLPALCPLPMSFPMSSSSSNGPAMASDTRVMQARASYNGQDIEALYAELHQGLFRTLFQLGVPKEDREDALHEVFIVALRRQDDFEGRSTAKTWLYGIAVHVADGYRRKAGLTRQRTEPLDDPTAVASATPAQDSPEQATSHPADDQSGASGAGGIGSDRARGVGADRRRGTDTQGGRAVLGISAPAVFKRRTSARKRFDKAYKRLGLR